MLSAIRGVLCRRYQLQVSGESLRIGLTRRPLHTAFRSHGEACKLKQSNVGNLKRSTRKPSFESSSALSVFSRSLGCEEGIGAKFFSTQSSTHWTSLRECKRPEGSIKRSGERIDEAGLYALPTSYILRFMWHALQGGIIGEFEVLKKSISLLLHGAGSEGRLLAGRSTLGRGNKDSEKGSGKGSGDRVSKEGDNKNGRDKEPTENEVDESPLGNVKKEVDRLWDQLNEQLKNDKEKQNERTLDSRDGQKERSRSRGGNHSEKEKDKERKQDEEEEDSKDNKEVTFQDFRRWIMPFFIVFVIMMLLVGTNPPVPTGNSFQGFKKHLAENRVSRIKVTGGHIVTAYLVATPDAKYSDLYYLFTIGSIESFETNLAKAIEELEITKEIPVSYEDTTSTGELIYWMLSIGSIALLFFLFRRASGASSNIFSIGKAKPIVIRDGRNIRVTFKDVAGLDEAKVEIMEFVSFLKSPAKFRQLGAKIPKGALLVGPPGTGKTLLAKATAGEAKVPFFSISGSDFLEMFVGVGPSRVRDLFATARKNAPCIVFIDEIDAVGRSRSNRAGFGGNDERENTLNQMLVEMDGFATTEGVVVLAGTNRAELLDAALLRPGRFDRQITIDKPDIKGRVDIFKVHLRPLKLGHDSDDLANRMAALTPGMVGADIANVCNEAALIAARSDKTAVELVDFEKAVDRIIGGLEKHSRVMSPEERKLVAFHESGHAVSGWFLEHADPLLKVTIVPRSSGALGFAQHLPKELSLYTVPQLLDKLVMILGGRAAEQVMYGIISTGASDDLQKSTRLAYAMVAKLGMSPRLSNLALHDSQDGEFQFTKPFSDHTAKIIDEEVSKIVSEQYARAIAILTEKKELLVKLANTLLDKETINHDVLVSILGPRPFVSDGYMKYMQIQKENVELAAKKEKEAAEAAKGGSAAAAGAGKEEDAKATTKDSKPNVNQ